MNQFTDFFSSFVDFNETIPWSNIAFLIVLYLTVLWVVVSIWVYYDAKKRYTESLTPLLFAVLVFFMNFPILVFYFAVRPDMSLEDFDDWEAGGVNVPIVNFMGREGIEMSFELRIHPKKLGESDKTNNMNIEIGWDDLKDGFRLIDRENIGNNNELENAGITVDENPMVKDQNPSRENNLKLKILNSFNGVKGKVHKKVKQINVVMNKKKSDLQSKSNSSNPTDAVHNKHKKKNKKKRR